LLGPDQIVVHEATCKHCGVSTLQPMSKAMLVKRRFVWVCASCLRINMMRLSRKNARKLKATFHRAYGTRISPEELQKFQANLDRLDDALREIV